MYRYLPAIMMMLATAAAAGPTWGSQPAIEEPRPLSSPTTYQSALEGCQEQTKSSCVPIVTDLGEQVPDLIMACRIVVLL